MDVMLLRIEYVRDVHGTSRKVWNELKVDRLIRFATRA